MDNYRLVWFQHFHKAAGSSVGILARKNGERHYPQQRNGNPYSKDGHLLPLWDYSAERLTAFVDHCQELGVTYVATEWGAPDFRVLQADPRVKSVSLLRDPWARIVSNYNYDMLNAYETLMPFPEYYFHHSLSFRQPEYYCRTLMRGLGQSKARDTDELLDRAFENLSHVDYAADIKVPMALEGLCSALGWNFEKISANKKPSALRGFLLRARRGDLGYLYRRWRLSQENWANIDAFASTFRAANVADFALMERLHQRQQASNDL